jgi:hypothetical protein
MQAHLHYPKTGAAKKRQEGVRELKGRQRRIDKLSSLSSN